MKPQTIAAAAAALALSLAACGKGGTGSGQAAANGSAPAAGNASASASTPVTAPAGEGLKLRPGRYETAMEMKVSGLPPEVAKAMTGTKMTSKSCITPEEANRPSGQMFGGDKAQGCKSQNMAYAGGRIHGSMTCPARNGGGASEFSMDGTYSAEAFDIRTRIVAHGAGSQAMTMEGHTVGRRIGECTGDGKDG
jgi:hypothetical protein